jgi:hypothetical protein
MPDDIVVLIVFGLIIVVVALISRIPAVRTLCCGSR